MHARTLSTISLTHHILRKIESGIARCHKRRIKTEEKAKVVTAVWGTECIQAVVAILHQVDLKKGMNSSYS